MKPCQTYTGTVTLSNKDREADIEKALRLMLDELGSRALDAVDINTTSVPFDGVLRTTWRELLQQGLVELVGRWNSAEVYAITGQGWLQALRITGRIDDPAFRGQMFTLKARLQAAVKSRHLDVRLYTDEFAAASGLSEDFVYNAIESELLDNERNIHGAYWDLINAKRGQLIVVPVQFGLPRL